MMQSITAAEFKESCLELLQQLDPEGLLITADGQPIARVMPCQPGDAGDADDAGDARTEWAALIGSLRGKAAVKGDIYGTGLSWSAES